MPYDQDEYAESCHEPSIYFAQADAGGPIKIGHTNNIEKRLGNLQPGNPSRLKCIGLFSAPRTMERELHQRFSFARIGRTEWFHPSEALLSFIHEETKA